MQTFAAAHFFPKSGAIGDSDYDCNDRVHTSSGNHEKSLKKKFHAWKNHGIWKKNLDTHGKIMEFCEII